MYIRIYKKLSDINLRFWRVNFYKDKNPGSRWYGGGYYDLETKKLYGWGPFIMNGANAIKIELNDEKNCYIMIDRDFMPTYELERWWEDHEHDREELILKAIADSLI